MTINIAKKIADTFKEIEYQRRHINMERFVRLIPSLINEGNMVEISGALFTGRTNLGLVLCEVAKALGYDVFTNNKVESDFYVGGDMGQFETIWEQKPDKPKLMFIDDVQRSVMNPELFVASLYDIRRWVKKYHLTSVIVTEIEIPSLQPDFQILKPDNRTAYCYNIDKKLVWWTDNVPMSEIKYDSYRNADFFIPLSLTKAWREDDIMKTLPEFPEDTGTIFSMGMFGCGKTNLSFVIQQALEERLHNPLLKSIRIETSPTVTTLGNYQALDLNEIEVEKSQAEYILKKFLLGSTKWFWIRPDLNELNKLTPMLDAITKILTDPPDELKKAIWNMHIVVDDAGDMAQAGFAKRSESFRRIVFHARKTHTYASVIIHRPYAVDPNLYSSGTLWFFIHPSTSIESVEALFPRGFHWCADELLALMNSAEKAMQSAKSRVFFLVDNFNKKWYLYKPPKASYPYNTADAVNPYEVVEQKEVVQNATN